MQGVFDIIQDALAQQLDGLFNSIPVWFDEALGTGDGETPEQDGDFIFVDILIPGLTTQGPQRTEVGTLVDIALYKKNADRREYRKLTEKIDKQFRPVFHFGDRAITVNTGEPKIVEGVLHYSFSFRFIPDCGEALEPGEPVMGDLILSM